MYQPSGFTSATTIAAYSRICTQPMKVMACLSKHFPEKWTPVCRRKCDQTSEPLGPQQGVSEIEQQPYRHEAGERLVENHDDPPSKPVAGQRLADRPQEEAEPNGQHDDVPHCYAPM